MNKPLFMSIKDASTVTGLSQKYLRQHIISGEIPHICVGTKYMINMTVLTDWLNQQSYSCKGGE